MGKLKQSSWRSYSSLSGLFFELSVSGANYGGGGGGRKKGGGGGGIRISSKRYIHVSFQDNGTPHALLKPT